MKRNRFLHSLLVLVAGVLAVNAEKPQSEPLVLTADTPWVFHHSQPEALEAALDDIQEDWYKVFGRPPNVVRSLPKEYKGPAVYFGNFPDWLIKIDRSVLKGKESHFVRHQQDNLGRNCIVAAGKDLRGTIYAMYTFSEKLLGVDPWYYWTDHEPERRASISVPGDLNIYDGNPTFTYRGWFINDEDLLNLFARDPMQENVFSLEMFDRVYETLLRLKGNMVVPATFPFPDERCYELAARRGLVLNMHHILVLGLNTYRWPHDSEAVFSYTQNKELMEKHWQTCIDAFTDYEVIWTVGYRGRHDRAFWHWEKGFDTDEARAAVINDAIAKQVEMVRAKHPDAMFIANMWDEGAKLYLDGHIKLPEGVTLVWPDNGVGTIRDEGNVKAGNGIYYHTAMMNRRANQLTELIPPSLIFSELGRFVKAEATSFLLNNVSDIRPVPLSTDAFMKMGWNAKPYVDDTPEANEQEFFLDWCQRQYGDELAPKLAALYKRYFYIPYTVQYDWQKHGKSVLHLHIRQLDDLFAGLVLQGKPATEELLKKTNQHLKFSANSVPYVEQLLKDVKATETSIPENRRDFYRGHLFTQTKIHLYSLYAVQSYGKAVLQYAEGDKASATKQIETCIEAYENLFATLGDAEYGKWAGWYRGEAFSKSFHNYDRARVIHARLTGQPEPLIRDVRDYGDIEQFQRRFKDNYPLLYPQAK